MRIFIFTILISLSLAVYSDSYSSGDIAGLWRTVLDEQQLLETGMKKEDIKSSASEMKFNEDGTMEVRIIDPANFKNKRVVKLVGVYKVEINRLRMSLVDGVWENQELTIDGKGMSLKPIEHNGKTINNFVRIREW